MQTNYCCLFISHNRKTNIVDNCILLLSENSFLIVFTILVTNDDVVPIFAVVVTIIVAFVAIDALPLQRHYSVHYYIIT